MKLSRQLLRCHGRHGALSVPDSMSALCLPVQLIKTSHAMSIPRGAQSSTDQSASGLKSNPSTHPSDPNIRPFLRNRLAIVFAVSLSGLALSFCYQTYLRPSSYRVVGWTAPEAPAHAQVISPKSFAVLGNVLPPTESNGSNVSTPYLHQAESALKGSFRFSFHRGRLWLH